MPPSHPDCSWVKNFDAPTLPCKNAKVRVRLGPKARCSNLLEVERLCGDISFCKL